MKYFKKIVGKRIYLSPISPEDCETYVNWLNDASVSDGIGTSGMVYTIEDEKKWIESVSGQYQFAIVTLDGDKLIGNGGIQSINPIGRCGEVGLFIGEEENRNQGFGAEALNLLLEYGFDILNLNNIMLKVFSFNERAIACYKKVGFQEIGRRRKSYYLRGQFYDEVFMDILKEER